MLAALFPPDETVRLKTLDELKLLDTPAEERFDIITSLAAQLFNVPIALISLIDQNRQWFKSHYGTEIRETDRAFSFCAHAILGNTTFVVENATLDYRFCDNPLVAGAPGIRFYAGHPIVAKNGSRLGTLCIIDTRPRSFATRDHETLQKLAQWVSSEINTTGLLNKLSQAEQVIEKSKAQHQKLEEQNRQTQTLLAKFYQNLPLPVVINRLSDGTFLDVNHQFVKTTGLSREELIGHNFAAKIKIDPKTLRKLNQQLTEKGLYNGEEIVYQLSDNTPRTALSSSEVFEVAGERYALTVFFELTAQKKATNNLKFMASVLSQVSDAVVVIDNEYRVTFWNSGAERVYNLAASLAVGRKLSELYQTEWLHPQDEVKAYQQLAETGSWQGEVRHIRQDAKVLAVEASTSILKDEAGHQTGLLAVIRDVTKRKQAEEALRQSENRFQAFMDHSPTPAWITDEDGVMLYISKPYSTLFGLSPEQTIGKKVAEVYPSEIAEEYMANIRTVGTTGKPVEVIEHFWYPDGTPGVVLVYKFPLYEDSGKILIGGVAVDITARLQTEEALRQSAEELRQAQKMEAIGRLAGGVAHDFNNLLTGILGYAELALFGVSDNDPLKADLVEIKHTAERGAALTRQLLAFSRRQMLKPVTLNLNEVVLGMQKLLERLIGEDIELEFKLNPRLYFTVADRGQLEQVIMNLALNARDAMPHGGKLCFITKNIRHKRAGTNEEYFVQLTVSDTGVGISKENLPHVFEPFFTTKAAGRGTGLGLATVFGIISQSGGQIEVSSTPGTGTNFEIYLPGIKSATSDKLPVVPALLPNMPLGQGETILLVEDAEEVRAVTRRILEQNGYRVLEAPGAAEALAICLGDAVAIELVLSDMVMPELNGLELASQIRRVRPNLPFLFMSGYSESRTGAGAALLEHYIEKPFSIDILLLKVNQVLGQASKTE